MLFEDLGLQAELVRAVRTQGYTATTPIQEQAIPHILEGRDVLAGAQTGTGKTAAFALPMLQRLSQSRARSRSPRALVLTPTRELAAQVGACARGYGRNLSIQVVEVFGGVSFQQQAAKLRQPVDIVVATPGRLLDHLEQATIDLSSVEILVLDEADRMLDMGFIRDIRRILQLLPKRRQNLLFSATFSREIKRLAADFLTAPVEVQVAQQNSAASNVHQLVHPVDRSRKRKLLAHCILEGCWQQVLVFTRTKHGANRLAQQLTTDGLGAVAIHGNKSQSARNRALSDFKDRKVRVLVATDIASRGLDITALPHVVNFELPSVPDDYVHRIGRTARAGRDGQAVSLVCGDEVALLADIEKLLGTEIERQVIPGFEPRTNLQPETRSTRQPPASHRTKSRKRPRRDSASSRKCDGSGNAHRKPKRAVGSISFTSTND